MKDIYGFLTFKKVEIIEKTDAHAYTTSISNDNSVPSDLFQAQILIILQEIIGNSYLK